MRRKLAVLVPLVALWAQAGTITSPPTSLVSIAAAADAFAGRLIVPRGQARPSAVFDENAAITRFLEGKEIGILRLDLLAEDQPAASRMYPRTQGPSVPRTAGFVLMGSALVTVSAMWSRRRCLRSARRRPTLQLPPPKELRAPLRAA